MKRYLLILAALAAVLAFVACAQQAAETTEPAAEPVAEAETVAAPEPCAEGCECEACAKGVAGENVWCETCNAGFVDGKKVACKGCVDAALAGTECEACKPKTDETAETAEAA